MVVLLCAISNLRERMCVCVCVFIAYILTIKCHTPSVIKLHIHFIRIRNTGYNTLIECNVIVSWLNNRFMVAEFHAYFVTAFNMKKKTQSEWKKFATQAVYWLSVLFFFYSNGHGISRITSFHQHIETTTTTTVELRVVEIPPNSLIFLHIHWNYKISVFFVCVLYRLPLSSEQTSQTIKI